MPKTYFFFIFQATLRDFNLEQKKLCVIHLVKNNQNHMNEHIKKTYSLWNFLTRSIKCDSTKNQGLKQTIQTFRVNKQFPLIRNSLAKNIYLSFQKCKRLKNFSASRFFQRYLFSFSDVIFIRICKKCVAVFKQITKITWKNQ